MLRKLRFWVMITVMSVVLGVRAASPVPGHNVSPDTLRVSLITCDQGPDIYQVFGHSAVRIQCSGAHGFDWVFNYGIFSFSDDFIYKFTKGETDYLLGVYDFNDFIVDYVMRGSSVYEQEIDLTPAQRERLFNMLVENAAPQNRVYRYNFLFDNCATRPRDMIEKAIAVDGEHIRYEVCDSLKSFRSLIRHYAANYSWLTFGIDLALGHDLDRKATWREQMFVPLILNNACNHAAIVQQDGTLSRPVVKGEATLYASGYIPVLPPTPWYISPLFVAIVLFLLTTAITACDVRKMRLSRWYDTMIFTALFVAGIIIYFLVLCSEHPATAFNINALWITPCAIIAAVLPYVRKAGKVVYIYHIANVALIALYLLLVAVRVQVIDVAVLPMVAAVAMRSSNYIYYSHKQYSK